MSAFNVGSIGVGENHPLYLIAGPCVIEDREHTLELARRIAEVCDACAVPLIFKASYDKANRSKPDAYRGPGLDAGCEILAAVKDAIGVPVTTDIHEPSQAARAAELGIDLLQIPAYLCRQTDLLTAAGETGRAVNVKKGQFMSPGAMENAVEKVRQTGNGSVMLTERGTCLGYAHLVNDMTAIPVMAGFDVPVVFDGTHSVQQPTTIKGSTGGNRAFIPTLVRAAVAAGCDGLFLEVHEEPERAPSDSTNMLPLGELSDLLARVKAIRAALEG